MRAEGLGIWAAIHPQVLAIITITTECLVLDKFPFSSYTRKPKATHCYQIALFVQAQVYYAFHKIFFHKERT